MLKYFSDVTNKVYDTEDELNEAELAVSKQKSVREARAKEVEAAIKEAQEANKKAHQTLADFCKDYGAYHKTFKDLRDFNNFGLFDWFSNMFMF